jgi:predicted nucleic acid-binding protein
VTVAKVVDASAIAALLFAEPEQADIAARIADATLISPDLLSLEVANVCWKKCRRDPDQCDAHLAAFALLARLSIEARRVEPDAVLALAMATGLTVYEASYLWLSRQLGLELVTLKQLEQAARSSSATAPPN